MLDEARGLVQNPGSPSSTRGADASRTRARRAWRQSTAVPPAGRAEAKPRSTATAGAPRRRRKRRGGTRADQAVELIGGQPGISASDVAKQMKIKPNYLYRVLGDLEKEGRVKKEGRKYFPAG